MPGKKSNKKGQSRKDQFDWICPQCGGVMPTTSARQAQESHVCPVETIDSDSLLVEMQRNAIVTAASSVAEAAEAKAEAKLSCVCGKEYKLTRYFDLHIKKCEKALDYLTSPGLEAPVFPEPEPEPVEEPESEPVAEEQPEPVAVEAEPIAEEQPEPEMPKVSESYEDLVDIGKQLVQTLAGIEQQAKSTVIDVFNSVKQQEEVLMGIVAAVEELLESDVLDGDLPTEIVGQIKAYRGKVKLYLAGLKMSSSFIIGKRVTNGQFESLKLQEECDAINAKAKGAKERAVSEAIQEHLEYLADILSGRVRFRVNTTNRVVTLADEVLFVAKDGFKSLPKWGEKGAANALGNHIKKVAMSKIQSYGLDTVPVTVKKVTAVIEDGAIVKSTQTEVIHIQVDVAPFVNALTERVLWLKEAYRKTGLKAADAEKTESYTRAFRGAIQECERVHGAGAFDANFELEFNVDGQSLSAHLDPSVREALNAMRHKGSSEQPSR